MSDLAKRLAFLSSGNSDGLDNPMCEEEPIRALEPEQPKEKESASPWGSRQLSSTDRFAFLNGIDVTCGRGGKAKRKSGFVENLIQRNETLQTFSADAMADSLDSYLDELDEGDAELRDSLISMGRKYHRDTSSTAKTSEISKAYASAEKKLRALHAEISDDKAAIQKDIDQMRLARSRNHKALAELVEVRTSLHNAQLAIIKEINHMRKDEFDLKQKEAKAAKDAEGDSANVNSNTLRSLFSIGRGNMVDAMGGYETISGATTSDEHGQPIYGSYSDEPPEDLDPNYRTDDENFDDRFLQFEDQGVQLVVLIDADETVLDVIAENKHGEQVYDYPMPTDYMNLNFDINRRLMTATDDYHRSYKVRQI